GAGRSLAQAAGARLARGVACFIVERASFDASSEHAAGDVLLVDGQLDRVLHLDPEARRAAGERRADPDPDHLTLELSPREVAPRREQSHQEECDRTQAPCHGRPPSVLRPLLLSNDSTAVRTYSPVAEAR